MNKFLTTRDLYNKYAPQFADKLDKIPETTQLDEFIAQLPPQAKVLDVGCGAGRDSEYLAQAGLQVTGIDLSENLIAEAKKRRPMLHFQVMDMEQLDFPEATFDGVWSKLAIIHIDRANFPAMLQSIWKLLKPGGVLTIETKAGAGEAFEKVSFQETEERFFVYYELDELIGLLQAAGFVQVDGYEYSVKNQHATKKKERVVVFGQKSR